jgi:hypothetical protein
MVGNADVEIGEEDLGVSRKVAISSQDLIMPNSKVILDWQR